MKTCEQCRYWDPYPDQTRGLCREDSPYESNSWPVTQDTDWCGKFDREAPLPSVDTPVVLSFENGAIIRTWTDENGTKRKDYPTY